MHKVSPGQVGAALGLKQYGALIVSSDPVLTASLRNVLQRHDCQTVCRATYAEASAFLSENEVPHLFVDVRPGALHQNPTELLGQLASRASQTQSVISVGGAGYDPSWAHLADIVFREHLSTPLDPREVHRSLQARFAPRREAELVSPWTMHVGKFRFVTHTTAMLPMLNQLIRIAPYDVTLLIVGETGTGKTTMAQMVHALSPRADEPFLTVPCGAMPPELMESELFGHTRGAFTGADKNRSGKFDAVGAGSILLDEIDVLGAAQQTKLLRVIETGEYEPVGGNETRQSRARLIVASNVDLRERMERQEFRADLYYRLNVLEFRLPPLRERPRDIVPLTLGFIQEFCDTHAIHVRRIHPEFLHYLKRFHWPGNIRELKNHVRRAVLFCKDGELTPHDLAPSLLDATSFEGAPSAAALAMPSTAPAAAATSAAILTAHSPPPSAPRNGTLEQRMEATEQEILVEVLAAHKFKRGVTADALGISRVALYKKMKKYGLFPLPTKAAKQPSQAESACQPIQEPTSESARNTALEPAGLAAAQRRKPR